MMESKRRPSTIAFALIPLISAFAIVGYFAWLRPYLAERQRVENEGYVWNFKFTFRGIQRDFFEKDLDGNKIHDFWTEDIAGLHRFGLIDRAVAEADAQPVVPLVPKPIPWHGYFFKSLPGHGPPLPEAQISDDQAGGGFRRKRFGFCAYPAEPGVTGKYIYIIDENGSPFRCPVDVMPVPARWPSEQELRNYWQRDCGG